MSTFNEEFITPKDVFELTGFSLKALSNNRTKKIGFPYYKFGGKVFYKKSEILVAIDSTRVATNQENSHAS
ncbi:MAG: hypothetical protein COA44_15180 [Arcobacter sp.]|nr:MAG: hypothetical protein COA44_15180 [Arcobacter sp.]